MNEVISIKGHEYITIVISGVNSIFDIGDNRAISPNVSQITGKENIIGAIPKSKADKSFDNGFANFIFELFAFSFSVAPAGEANTIIPIVERNES